MNKLYHFFILFFLLLPALPSIAQVDFEPVPKLNRKFQVVVHEMVSPTTGMLVHSLGALNLVLAQTATKYSRVGISFEVCKRSAITNEFYRKIDTVAQLDELIFTHFEPNRINVFLVDSLYDDVPIIRSRAIVMLREDFEGFLLANRFGYFFGLEPTFGSGDKSLELVDGSNCATEGDKICDTPADPGGGDVNGACAYVGGLKDANGDYYTPKTNNMMSDYAGCRCEFSNDQLRKIVENYYSNSNLNTLW